MVGRRVVIEAWLDTFDIEDSYIALVLMSGAGARACTHHERPESFTVSKDHRTEGEMEHRRKGAERDCIRKEFTVGATGSDRVFVFPAQRKIGLGKAKYRCA